MRLYTYLPKNNTAAIDGLLSTSLSDRGFEKYRGRTGKWTKADVLKALDAKEKGWTRSKSLSALPEPIPADAAHRFRAFADDHRLYSFDTKDLIRRRLLRHIRLARTLKGGGSDEVKAPKQHAIDWNGNPGSYLFSGIPHYFVETKDGKIPADLVREEKTISFPDDEIGRLKGQNRIFTTRVSDDFSRYSEGDIVAVPWGSRFRVSKRIVIPNLRKHPFYDKLTESQRSTIGKYKDIAGLWLDKIEEKTAETPYRIQKLTGSSLTDSQVKKLVALFRQLDAAEQRYEDPYGLRVTRPNNADLRKWLRTRDTLLAAVRKNGDILGFANSGKAQDYTNAGYIGALVVDRDHRGEGIGRAILRKALRDNRRQHLKTVLRVHLNNTVGNRLYASEGFVPTSQTMVADENKSKIR